MQWWVQAVGVITDIAVVTQQKTGGVRSLPTNLANDTFQAAPALTKHRLSDLQRISSCISILTKCSSKERYIGRYIYFDLHTERMVTLGTLGTRQQLPFRTLSKAATHDTHVLKGANKGDKKT